MTGFWQTLRELLAGEPDPLQKKLERTDLEVERNLRAHAKYQAEVNEAIAALQKATGKDRQ